MSPCIIHKVRKLNIIIIISNNESNNDDVETIMKFASRLYSHNDIQAHVKVNHIVRVSHVYYNGLNNRGESAALVQRIP